jgi:hypothetical protein
LALLLLYMVVVVVDLDTVMILRVNQVVQVAVADHLTDMLLVAALKEVLRI